MISKYILSNFLLLHNWKFPNTNSPNLLKQTDSWAKISIENTCVSHMIPAHITL